MSPCRPWWNCRIAYDGLWAARTVQRCNGAGRSGCRESHHHQGHEKQKVGMEVLSPTVWKWSISIQSYSKKCRSCPLKQIGARNSIILSNCLPKSEICQECNVYVPFCNLILWQFSMITFLIRVHPTHIAIIHLALQRDQLPFPWELQGLSTLVLMFFCASKYRQRQHQKGYDLNQGTGRMPGWIWKIPPEKPDCSAHCPTALSWAKHHECGSVKLNKQEWMDQWNCRLQASLCRLSTYQRPQGNILISCPSEFMFLHHLLQWFAINSDTTLVKAQVIASTANHQ